VHPSSWVVIIFFSPCPFLFGFDHIYGKRARRGWGKPIPVPLDGKQPSSMKYMLRKYTVGKRRNWEVARTQAKTQGLFAMLWELR